MEIVGITIFCELCRSEFMGIWFWSGLFEQEWWDNTTGTDIMIRAQTIKFLFCRPVRHQQAGAGGADFINPPNFINPLILLTSDIFWNHCFSSLIFTVPSPPSSLFHPKRSSYTSFFSVPLLLIHKSIALQHRFERSNLARNLSWPIGNNDDFSGDTRPTSTFLFPRFRLPPIPANLKIVIDPQFREEQLPEQVELRFYSFRNFIIMFL